MDVSAELRWFWRGPPAPAFAAWFREAAAHGMSAGGGDFRIDDYLRDERQSELGLKHRGGGSAVEVKGLVAASLGESTAEPFAGQIELWCKWRSETLELDKGRLLRTEKRRWLRKFDAGRSAPGAPAEVQLGRDEQPVERERERPQRGCNVELTEIQLVDGARWWTFAFEAFGTVDTVADDLRACAALLAARRPPPLASGMLAGYPSWLRHCNE